MSTLPLNMDWYKQFTFTAPEKINEQKYFEHFSWMLDKFGVAFRTSRISPLAFTKHNFRFPPYVTWRINEGMMTQPFGYRGSAI